MIISWHEIRDMAVDCPKWRVENWEDSRFCSNCAAPLNQTLPVQPSLNKTMETPVRILKSGSLTAGIEVIEKARGIARDGNE